MAAWAKAASVACAARTRPLQVPSVCAHGKCYNAEGFRIEPLKRLNLTSPFHIRS